MLLCWRGLVLVAASASAYSTPHWNVTDIEALSVEERHDRLVKLTNSILALVGVSRSIVGAMQSLVRSGTASTDPIDFETIRQSLFDHMVGVSDFASISGLYAAFEDGTFSGYFHTPDRTTLYHQLLHGEECGFNYSAACGVLDEPCAAGYPPAQSCFRMYAIDQYSGVPVCSPANTTPASGETPHFAPEESCWFENHIQSNTFDPRFRPWYVAGAAAPGGETFWSDVYEFVNNLDRVIEIGVTTGRALIAPIPHDGPDETASAVQL